MSIPDSKSRFEKARDFMTADHTCMIENMNRISDGLLRAYWYLLATIGALGIAYKFVLDTHEKYSFLVCIVGNIILWKVSEYALSHGFLFRYIQAKAAKLELEVYTMPSLRQTIRNPADIASFADFKDNTRDAGNLCVDHIIPDQFVPLYWATGWLIIINTATAFYFYHGGWIFTTTFFSDLLIFLLISLPLILKLWNYYAYKIRQFLNTTCDFSFVERNPIEPFYRIPFLTLVTGAVIGVASLILFASLFDLDYLLNDQWHYELLVTSTLGFFWPVILGLFIHILRFFLRGDVQHVLKWLLPEIKRLSPSEAEEYVRHHPRLGKKKEQIYVVELTPFQSTVYLLYVIV